MRNLIPHVLIVLLLAISISAQGNQPQLLDEFGQMPLDEMNARLDGVAFEISKIPKSKALVRIYGGEGGAAYVRGSWMKSLWNVNRKNPPERILVQFCNINKEPLWTRIFVVRENDNVEVCEENLLAPRATTHFETIYFGFPNVELVPMEDSFMYVDAVGQGEYSRFAQEALKRLLSIAPQSRVYLVSYLQTDFDGNLTSRNASRRDKKSLASKMLQSARQTLLNKGFPPSQIVTVNGGYVNGHNRRLEIWFVPDGGAIPKPKLDYVPKKNKN